MTTAGERELEAVRDRLDWPAIGAALDGCRDEELVVVEGASVARRLVADVVPLLVARGYPHDLPSVRRWPFRWVVVFEQGGAASVWELEAQRGRGVS